MSKRIASESSDMNMTPKPTMLNSGTNDDVTAVPTLITAILNIVICEGNSKPVRVLHTKMITGVKDFSI